MHTCVHAFLKIIWLFFAAQLVMWWIGQLHDTCDIYWFREIEITLIKILNTT